MRPKSSTYRTFLPCLLLLLLVLAQPARAQSETAAQLYADGVQAYQAGNVAGAKQKLALALEVDKNFRPASALLNRINLAPPGTAATPGMSYVQLARTVVPVEFKDTTLNSALEFIRQKADEQTGGKLKINFVVNLPPELASKRVTLQMNNVPVSELLKYIGSLVGVNFETQRYAVVVTPAASAAPAGSPAPGVR